jgi:hypothetical protein
MYGYEKKGENKNSEGQEILHSEVDQMSKRMRNLEQAGPAHEVINLIFGLCFKTGRMRPQPLRLRASDTRIIRPGRSWQPAIFGTCCRI